MSRVTRELLRNREAVNDLIVAAELVPDARWAKRPAPESWTAAQQANHVVLSYRAIVHDVRDGQPAKFIGTSRQRHIWRLLGLTYVLWLGKIPAGATAPRELRPPAYSPNRQTLLRELRAALDSFERVMLDAARTQPGHRVAHPYFGWLSLRQAIRVCATHTRHHAALIGNTTAS